MKKFCVFLEAVDDPEDPLLMARLMELSHRSEGKVEVLLGKLPVQLAEGVDREGARYLSSFMEGVGAHLRVEEMLPGTKVRSANGAPRQRPVGLGVSSRFSWCFEVFARTWGRQLMLMVVMVVAALLSESAVAWLAGAFGGVEITTDDPLALAQLLRTPLFFTLILVLRIAFYILLFWYLAALIRLTASCMEGKEDIPLAKLMSAAWRRLPELITAVVIWLLPLFFGFGIVTLAAGALFLPEHPSYVSLIILAALVPICFYLVAFSLVAPVVVLETIDPRQGLRRAWILGRGRRWRIFGNLLLAGVGVVVVAFVVELLLGSLGFPKTAPGALVVWLFSYGLGLLLLFLLNFVVTAFYYEGQVLSEGWEPPWESVPHPSWPVSEVVGMPAQARGVRAWMELLLTALAALLLLLVVLAVLSVQMGR